MLSSARAAVPELRTVTVLVDLLLTVTAPKSTGEGERATVPVWPMPLRATVVSLPAPSVRDRLPLRVPEAVGLNTRLMTHVAPAFNVVPQSAAGDGVATRRKSPED